MSATHLLDTCAWIDALLAPELLSAKARSIIGGPNKLALSTISLLEVARKEAKGELTLRMPIQEWFEKIALPVGKITLLPITPVIAIDATRLPQPFINRQGRPHKDPADQLIVATARHHNLTLLTSDGILNDYAYVNTLNSRA